MRKYARYIAIVVVSAVILLLSFIARPPSRDDQAVRQAISTKHIYASWDVMEFDKCVAAWLIMRFIDKDAQFVFYPQGTEIKEGIVFDVPGAEWSRKHRKCTSQCVLESMSVTDPALDKIVTMASQTELNFWQLDRWPETQNHFCKIKELMDQNPDPQQCYKKTFLYFDELYEKIKKDIAKGGNI